MNHYDNYSNLEKIVNNDKETNYVFETNDSISPNSKKLIKTNYDAADNLNKYSLKENGSSNATLIIENKNNKEEITENIQGGIYINSETIISYDNTKYISPRLSSTFIKIGQMVLKQSPIYVMIVLVV